MTSEATSTAARKARRRWLRYSLRTLFFWMFVMAIYAAWYGYMFRKAQRQRQVIAWVLEHGGSVNNEEATAAQHPTDGFSEMFLGQGVLVLTVDFTPKPNYVLPLGTSQLPIVERSDLSDIGPLAELDDLWQLDLSHTQVTDLSPLANLPDLEILFLNNTPVSDLAPLSGMKKLRQLVIYDTPARDLAPLDGVTTLEEIMLDAPQVSQLPPLSRLPNLRVIGIRVGTGQLSDEQEAAIHQTLPDCEIRYFTFIFH